MKTLSNSTKKIIVALLLIVSVAFFGNISTFASLLSARDYYYHDESSISIENGDFTSYTRGNETGTPFILGEDDGWTVTSDASVVKGVINVDEETFKDNDNYGLAENPGRASEIDSKTDYYVLMFGSKLSSRARAVSSDVTLSSATYYELSIYVKSIGSGLASVNAQIGNESATFNDLSNQGWRKYYILIATDDVSSATLRLTLGYSGTGSQTMNAVLFDNVEINEISNADFYETQTSANLLKVDLREERSTATSFTNSNFEEGSLSGFTTSSSDSIGVYSTEEISSKILSNFSDVDETNPARTFVNGNSYSLLFINKDDSSTSTVETSSDNFITIPQHSYYKLTLLIKTGNLSGDGLTIALVPDNGELEESDGMYIDEVSQTNQTSSSGLDSYNGFAFVTFYVKGGIDSESRFGMRISLGEGSGWAIVDDIVLTPISASEYSSTNALDFSSTYTNTSDILNGDFNLSENESYNLTYPLKPEDWTFTSGNTGDQGGIIRVDDEYFSIDASNFGNPTNPGYNDAYYTYGATNENVLMVRTTSSNASYFTTENTTAISATTLDSEGTISKVFVGVKTLGNATAFIRIVDENNNIIASFENINTNNKWEMRYIYINNGVSSLNFSVIVGTNGTTSSSASNGNYAFFDTISMEDAADDITIAEMTSANSLYVDFLNNTFTSSTNFSGYESSDENYNFRSVNTVQTRLDARDNYVLQVESNDEYQTIISDYTYSLTSGSYYEISVWIKTNIDTNLTTTGGAHFELVNIDEEGKVLTDEENENENKFINIVAESNNENNGWVKYSMYVLAHDDVDVKILLGLGLADTPAYGRAYFDDLTVQEISEETYASQSANANTIVSDVIEITPSEEDEGDGSGVSTPINVWILVSSILLVVALLLAIAGFLIRRIPKNKTIVKSTPTEYSKKASDVDEASIKTRLKLQREENLSNLKTELEKLQKEYDELKNEYEKQIAETDDVDKNIYKVYTKKANKLMDRIEYLSSAVVYLEDEENVHAEERREIAKEVQLAKENSKKLNETNDTQNEHKDKSNKDKK